MGAAAGYLSGRVCFAAGTKVVVGLNPDGSFIERDIQDLRPGDKVLSKDQYDEQGKRERRTILRTFVHTAYALQIVKIRDKDGNVETIRTTSEHPFWVAGLGWVGAIDLKPGMRLDEADGSDDAVIVSSTAQLHPEGISVYNFEVEGDHTYFVEDGQGEATAVWVHNTCSKVSSRQVQRTRRCVGCGR